MKNEKQMNEERRTNEWEIINILSVQIKVSCWVLKFPAL